MARALGPVRRVMPPNTPGLVQAEGRKLLGALEQRLALGGQQVGSAQRTIEVDGTYHKVIASTGPGGRQLIVIEEPTETTTTSPAVALWIPQGIVLVPAADAAPQGWGLPQAEPGTDPGPLTSAWTVNGALPQVLLTTVDDAGYPDDTDASTPLYFDDEFAPDFDFDIPDLGTTWAAYRIRFRDLGAGYRQVLEEINGRRDPDQPLCPPFAGYADLAVVEQALIASFGVDDTTYPIGSKTNFRRIEKDGTVRAVGTALARGQLGGGVLPPDLDVGGVVDALVALQPEITDDTFDCGTSFSIVGAAPYFVALLDHVDQWIHCGNIDWVSIHPEIPRLSWLGSRGRSIPSWELATGLVETLTYNGVLLTPAAAWSYAWIDTAVADFQGYELKQFSPCIYARGRLLAQLPLDGYVLGAAIQRITPDADAPDQTIRYVLVAIAWHRNDQKAHEAGEPAIVATNPRGVHWDSTSDIRTWAAELPTRAGLACCPEYVVDGEFDETTNPRGWKAIARHRLTTLDDADVTYWLGDTPEQGSDYDNDPEFGAPKGYWQTWMFNGSGTRAVATRSATYVSRSPISPFALVTTGPVGPCVAIECAIDAGELTSACTIVWKTPLGIVFDIGERLPFAWDFAGNDVARVAWFGGPEGSESAGPFAIENSAGGAVLSWAAFANPSGMALAYDARTDTGILAAYTFETDAFTSVDHYFVHDGAIRATRTSPIPDGVGVGFAGWGNGFTYLTAPEWNKVHGHGTPLPCMAVYDGDYVLGIWDGAVPGGPAGLPPFDAETDFVRVTGALVSSIDDIGTLVDLPAGGWGNFAGVT